MKKVTVFLTVVISTILYISCDSNTTQEISSVVANPTYTANVKTVIDSKCTGCHSGGNQNPNLETYLEVKEATATETGTVLCRINDACGDVMPTSGKMPQQTIDMIQRWADQGFAE